MAALERCVGDVDDFVGNYWGRAPLLRVRDEPSFDDLASLTDLDAMVSSLGLSSSRLRMVRAGETLQPSAYTSSPGAKQRGQETFINPSSVYRLYSEGATIVLESLHRYWAPLTDFCRDLEVELGHRLQVNAYITPPGSQGFDVHRDEHDVFVLQVTGRKHWLVFDRDDEDAVVIDANLEPGSALYIPKGFPHAATTGENASAHLTVGIITHESIEIIRQVAKLAEKEPMFQERLPVGAVRDVDALRGFVSSSIDELRSWLDKVDIDELTQRLARRVATTSQPIVRDQLRQLELIESISESTEVARRRGAPCLLLRTDTVLKVVLADRELEMPLTLEPAMRLITQHDRFQPVDLHALLTPESALILVRRLVREGLLEVIVDV